MAEVKGQPKIRNPFEEYEEVKANRFNILFPKEVGIKECEVRRASFHHDDVIMEFRCFNKTRTLKTLKELEHEGAAVDFRFLTFDATGVVCHNLLFKQYVVNEVSFEADYEMDHNLTIQVAMKAAEQYISFDGVHYTFDNGVTFDDIVPKEERVEILKNIEERIHGEYRANITPVCWPNERKKLSDAYLMTVRYSNHCQRYIQSLFAEFIDDDNRDVFAYRKSRQVGSTTFLKDIVDYYLTFGKKVLVISDHGGLTQFKSIKDGNLKQSTTLRNISQRYDLVIITENLMYRNQYQEGDVEEYITPVLLPGGKVIIELPAYVHDFYDCDDNYMPWWLDDKKVGGENGNVELWVDKSLNTIMCDMEESIRVYKANRDMFNNHKAFFHNRWSERMNKNRYPDKNQFPYNDRWWEEMGE